MSEGVTAPPKRDSIIPEPSTRPRASGAFHFSVVDYDLFIVIRNYLPSHT